MLPGLINRFNRGEVAPEALARLDVDRIRNTGSFVNNFIPQRLGPMQFRPGWEYLDALPAQSMFHAFVAATDDLALLEFSNNKLRVWVDDQLITRTSVTTAITNGSFATDLSGWTDDSDTGGAAIWEGGRAKLTGNSLDSGVIYQTLTTQTGVEHALRVIVEFAPVRLRIGTTGARSYDIFDGRLGPGTHSLVFTPGANVTLTFSNAKRYSAHISDVSFEGAGVLDLPTTVTTANLSNLRLTQSVDVVFVTCTTEIRPFRIERRGTKSWSIVSYDANDGPFQTINDTAIQMRVNALQGDALLIASESFFSTDNIGQLFRLSSAGQKVEADVTASPAGTESIRVTGVGGARPFRITLAGTWTGTVTLQRSPDNATWENITTFTANTVETYNDDLDNAILYYRLYVTSGPVTGTIEMELFYGNGSIDGIGRVFQFISDTQVRVQVLKDFGSTVFTRDWYAGEWSLTEGYPSAVTLYESRLWFAGKNRLWGSITDAYESFDDSVEGDSGPIGKTIGFGPADNVYWLSGAARLLMGLASDEISVRSSALGEVLTPTNANLKSGSNQGSANAAPTLVDEIVYFIQRSGEKIYALEYSLNSDSHAGADLTVLNPSICEAGVKRIAHTRQPESRLWMVMNDGTMRIYMFDPSEDVTSWSRVSIDGLFEDVVVLPGLKEDRVYAVVNRSGARSLVRLALFSEARGGSLSATFDMFVRYTSPGLTISGLDHLEGEDVRVWGDGLDRGSFTVSSGEITVGSSWTDVVVGLQYEADFISNKLNDFGTAADAPEILTRLKRIFETGLVAKDFVADNLFIGPDANSLKPLPLIEKGTTRATGTQTDYDQKPFELDDDTETDPRIHIRANGPVTLMALTYGLKGSAS